jgi:hypothetical protein
MSHKSNPFSLLPHHVYLRNVVTVQAREDVEVHLHALQTMTEQVELCEWGHYLGKLHHCSEIMSGLWDAPDYPTCPHTLLQ